MFYFIIVQLIRLDSHPEIYLEKISKRNGKLKEHAIVL